MAIASKKACIDTSAFIAFVDRAHPKHPQAALKTLINYGGTELSFKDVQTAVLADRNGISQICTFDYLHPLFGQTAFSPMHTFTRKSPRLRNSILDIFQSGSMHCLLN